MPTVTELGKVKDKTQTIVSVNLSSALGGSIIVPFFLREAASLIEKGWAQPVIMGTNDSKVIYVEIEDEVAGFIVFNYQNDYQKTTWIVIGTVFEKYRGRGLYKIMHSHLEQIAKNNNSGSINSHVHRDNAPMLAICKSIGKETLFYRTTMELKD
jgi:RimJ/RimL family protein N-acetyltransferase